MFLNHLLYYFYSLINLLFLFIKLDTLPGVNDGRGLSNNSDLYDQGFTNQQSDITNERLVSQSTLSCLSECDSFTVISDWSDPLSVDSIHANHSAMNDKIPQDKSKKRK